MSYVRVWLTPLCVTWNFLIISRSFYTLEQIVKKENMKLAKLGNMGKTHLMVLCTLWRLRFYSSLKQKEKKEKYLKSAFRAFFCLSDDWSFNNLPKHSCEVGQADLWWPEAQNISRRWLFFFWPIRRHPKKWSCSPSSSSSWPLTVTSLFFKALFLRLDYSG